jgi:UDP-N-acetylglucosamine 2-epimerase (non-hydrolysing)
MPEEINRLVTDALAELLLTPSPDADENLRREGVPEARIRQVGNVMIDTLSRNLERARARQAPQRLGVEPRRYIYVTLHRPSNVDERGSLAAIVEVPRRRIAPRTVSSPSIRGPARGSRTSRSSTRSPPGAA